MSLTQMNINGDSVSYIDGVKGPHPAFLSVLGGKPDSNTPMYMLY